MAEGPTTPEVATAGEDNAVDSGPDIGTVTPPESPVAGSTEKKGLLGLLGGLFGRKKEATIGQVEKQETPKQVRERMAALQADKKNVETFMRSPDSTGSSKIQDEQRLSDIEGTLADLQAKLPAEINTTSTDSSTPVESSQHTAVPTPSVPPVETVTPTTVDTIPEISTTPPVGGSAAESTPAGEEPLQEEKAA